MPEWMSLDDFPSLPAGSVGDGEIDLEKYYALMEEALIGSGTGKPRGVLNEPGFKIVKHAAQVPVSKELYDDTISQCQARIAAAFSVPRYLLDEVVTSHDSKKRS